MTSSIDRMLEATALAEERHFWFRGLRRNARLLLEEALDGRRPERIIDCGSGTGRNLDWLDELGPSVGVERSLTGLRVGRAHNRRLVQASVTNLPFPDASADVATSFDVLYCLDDESEKKALDEMWRVLKPGGVVLVNAAALDVLHGSHSVLTMERRRYTPERLAGRLTRAGFSIGRITFTNMLTFPIALAVRAAERLTGRAAEASEADLQVPFGPLNAALSGVTAIDGGLLRFVNLPIGTSLLCVARKPAARST